MFFGRAPNPDTVLIIQSPLGVFSTKSLLQNNKRNGSRLISSNRLKLEEASIVVHDEVEPLSAARCRVFKRLNNKVPQILFLCMYIYTHIQYLWKILPIFVLGNPYTLLLYKKSVSLVSVVTSWVNIFRSQN